MNERLKILQLIESDQISVAEGVRRLEALSPPDDGTVEEPEAGTAFEPSAGGEMVEADEAPERPAFVSVLCWVIFGVGVGALAAGGWMLARAYAHHGPGAAWGWVILVVGLLAMALGWWLRQARWFYLRFRERDGSRFRLALPLPLSMVAWLVRVAKPFVPQLGEMEVEALILAMERELREGRSCVVRVDEGGDGDQVEMYFV